MIISITQSFDLWTVFSIRSFFLVVVSEHLERLASVIDLFELQKYACDVSINCQKKKNGVLYQDNVLFMTS